MAWANMESLSLLEVYIIAGVCWAIAVLLIWRFIVAATNGEDDEN